MQVAPAVNVAPQVFSARNDVALVPPSVMESSSTVAVPEFVSVTVCTAELLPTFSVPNARVVVLSFSAGTAVPVPVSVTFCGDPVALSVMVSVPVSAPAAVGLKATYTEQEAFAASVAAQPFRSTNDVALVPPSAIELSVTLAVPVLVSVTVCRSLVVPTAVLGKASDVMLTDRVVELALAPVPDRATVCGVDEAESV